MKNTTFKILVFGAQEQSHFTNQLIQKTRHEIHQTSNLPDVLISLIENDYDLVLIHDLNHERDSVKACRIIKSHSNFEKLPVIYLAGVNSVGSLIHAYEAGADEYIEYPLDMAEVIDKVELSLILNEIKNNTAGVNYMSRQRINMINHEINNTKRELLNQKLTTMKTDDDLTKLNVELLKGKFLKIIIQELRSPVSAIIGFTDILKENEIEEETKTLYDSMGDASRKSKDLLDIAFLITEIDPEKSAGKMRPYRVSNLIEYAMDDNYDMIHDKNITINIPEEAEVSEVVIDPGLIKEVVRMVLHNALWYSPKNSSIDISMNETVDRVELQIRDSGIGFTLKDLTSVSSFLKTPGMAKKSEWPGLRFAITKFIMDIHHSEIQVENNDIGGATVKLIFPVNNAQREELHQLLSQLN